MTLSVETRALTRSFGRVQALRELDLVIEEGSVYALMGPNGAGKSTLIKLLMNLLSPSSGSARLLGQESTKLHGQPLEQIGYVSENQKLPEWMTVEQYLGYCRPFYPRWDRELEQRLLSRFELKPGQKLKRLSRGMKMKAALASALAFRPRLLILDEPLSGLDPLVRDELLGGLNELKHETTVLLSSHDLAEVDSFASHVGYLDGGRLLLSTTIGDLRQRFRGVEAVIGRPLDIPAEIPSEWESFSPTPTGACWVERGYDEQRSAQRAAAVFPGAAITAKSLTLREVFLVMAHGERKAKGGAQ
jgi:ABC-2 type transport system ATP-binding protein